MTEFPFPQDQILDTSYYGANGIPHELFAWLRENDPVRKFEVTNYKPFWAITKNEHIHEIEGKSDIFLSYPRPILTPETRNFGDRDEMTPEAKAFVDNLMKDSPVAELFQTGEIMRTLIHMDAPDHAKYRQLVQPWFKPRNLAVFEDQLTDITNELLDKMMGDGGMQECEFVGDVAVYHPLRMLCVLLGVPRSDEGLILKLTNEFFAGDDEDLSRSDNPLDFLATVKEIFEYFYDLVEDRRKNPTEDLGSYIANGEIDGKPLPLKELVSYFLVIATAGHDTTRNAIAGGCLALLRNPDQMKKWQDDPELTNTATEEIIRWTVPVIQFARTAAADYEIVGKQIKSGDILGLFYASGSRDESVIQDPYAFRVDRQPNRHVAFGSGPHICLGRLLARMEVRVFFTNFLKRLESIELADEPKLIKSSFIHGVKRLPIWYKLKPAA